MMEGLVLWAIVTVLSLGSLTMWGLALDVYFGDA